MSTETTTTPVYVSVKTKGNYKITAEATTLTAHKGTNMLVEKEEVVVLDDVLYEGFYSADLAVFQARKDIEKLIKAGLKVKMEDIGVTARPFRQ
jgi:hypothetical protein